MSTGPLPPAASPPGTTSPGSSHTVTSPPPEPSPSSPPPCSRTGRPTWSRPCGTPPSRWGSRRGNSRCGRRGHGMPWTGCGPPWTTPGTRRWVAWSPGPPPCTRPGTPPTANNRPPVREHRQGVRHRPGEGQGSRGEGPPGGGAARRVPVQHPRLPMPGLRPRRHRRPRRTPSRSRHEHHHRRRVPGQHCRGRPPDPAESEERPIRTYTSQRIQRARLHPRPVVHRRPGVLGSQLHLTLGKGVAHHLVGKVRRVVGVIPVSHTQLTTSRFNASPDWFFYFLFAGQGFLKGYQASSARSRY